MDSQIDKSNKLKKTYSFLMSNFPMEMKKQMELFHLTPEMMTDSSLTLDKYLKYLVDNDLKLPQKQMQQVMSLAKTEESYRQNLLQKNTQWINRNNIASVNRFSGINWRSRVQDNIKAARYLSFSNQEANKLYKNFADELNSHKERVEEWIDRNRLREQLKAISKSLDMGVGVDNFMKSESKLTEMASHVAEGYLSKEIITQLLTSMAKYSDDYAKANRIIAKKDSINNAKSAADGVTDQINDTVRASGNVTGSVAAASADDVVRGVAASSSDDVARGAASSGADDAAQVASNSISPYVLASIGPLATLGGLVLDQNILNKHKDNINRVLETNSRFDIKTAIDYAKENDGRNLSDLTDKQRWAAINLVEMMERNGGVRLLTQKIIRDVGTVSGVVGGPGGGLSVLGVMKIMEEDDKIPDIRELEEGWKNGNTLGGAYTGLLALIAPPSLLFTVPAMISGNVAMNALKENIKDWNKKMHSDEGRKDFLYDVGSRFMEIEKAGPDKFKIENLQNHHLFLAEKAASRMVKGRGKHKLNDFVVISQFANSVDHWFPDDGKYDVISKYRNFAAKDLVAAINKSGLQETPYKVKEAIREDTKMGFPR
ncbi:MAG: hypothetical protein R3D71_06560 [Rickettsiales bacterium]